MMKIGDIKDINYEITGHSNLLSEHMLNSALSSYHYYEDIEDQIASIFRGLIKNHAFRDGNKRTALIALLTLCEDNDINLNMSDDELAKVTIDIAENKYSVEEITKKIFK